MACEAIKEVQRQFCLRGELCPMGKFLCDYFGVPGLYDLVSEVHRDPAGRKKLAASAQLLSESSQSDILEPWSHIEERAGQGLACLVGDLFPSPSGMSEEIFVSGSVLLKNERVKKALNLALNTKGKIIVRLQEPQYDAAMGAGFIALRQIQSGPMEDERR